MPHIHDLYDFTISAYVLHPTEQKICLHFHKKLNVWNQFGGHIELDEDPMQSLVRELEEEAGLKPDDYEIIKTAEEPDVPSIKTVQNGFGIHIFEYVETGHKHIDIPYIIKSLTEDIRPQDGESTQIIWCTIDEVRELNKQKMLHDSTLSIMEWIFERMYSKK